MKDFLQGVRDGILILIFVLLSALCNKVEKMEAQQKEDSARIKSLNNNLYSLREELYKRP
jgi:hypothetical protein